MKRLFIDCEHYEGVNVFQMLLANMFSDFNDVLQDNRHYFHNAYDSHQNKRKLLTLFQTIQTSLEVITNRYDYSECMSLEALSLKGTATNINGDFNKLFLMYNDLVEDISFVLMNYNEKDLYYLKKYMERGQSGYTFQERFFIQKRFPDTDIYSVPEMMSLINNNSYRPH